MQPWRIEWRRAGALAIAIGLLSGCLLTSNFDGLTGGLVPIDGGANAGGGGASSSVSVSVSAASAGGGSSTGGATSSSSAASSSSGGGAAFPSTPIRDDFHRPAGDLDGQWLTEVSDTWTIAGWKLHTDGSLPGIGGSTGRPGAILWPTVFGVDQEAYFTFPSALDPGVSEVELLLKHHGPPNECDSVTLIYHPPSLEVWVCESGNFTKLPDQLDVMFAPGDQMGARAHADGTVEAYKNGLLIMTWDASAWSQAKGDGQIGIEADGIGNTGVLLLTDFGGG